MTKTTKAKEKIIIYQVFTRLFGNTRKSNVINGSYQENGCGKMAHFNTRALNEIKALGANHIWFTGIIEHATQTNYEHIGITPDHPAVVKGKAGSPYAIKDYYDVDPDLAVEPVNRLKEFTNLIARCHKANLKVIIDFVPNHVARQYHSDAKPDGVIDLGENDNTNQSFSPNNNFYYINWPLNGIDLKKEAKESYSEMPAKATGNDRFDASVNVNDWYETVKLNYGVDYQNNRQTHFDPIPDTWIKMRDILLFWADKGIDGFRCDMAEMVPVQFWEWAIRQVKELHPELIFIAEVYNPYEYRNYIFQGGFDYLYDKVGLYDTLRGIVCQNGTATAITQCWQQLNDIQDHMLNFLENHDEQRIASQFFAGNPQKAIPALVVSACMNTNPFMLYFGEELGEKGMNSEGFSGCDGRTTIFDYWTIETVSRWNNKGKFNEELLTDEEKQLRKTHTCILNLCNSEKAIQQGLFYDLMYANFENPSFNVHRQYTFLRKYGKELLLIIANFQDVASGVAINLPPHAFEFLEIKAGSYKATDLMGTGVEQILLTPETPVVTQVLANTAKILKIKF